MTQNPVNTEGRTTETALIGVVRPDKGEHREERLWQYR